MSERAEARGDKGTSRVALGLFSALGTSTEQATQEGSPQRSSGMQGVHGL